MKKTFELRESTLRIMGESNKARIVLILTSTGSGFKKWNLKLEGNAKSNLIPTEGLLDGDFLVIVNVICAVLIEHLTLSSPLVALKIDYDGHAINAVNTLELIFTLASRARTAEANLERNRLFGE
jgi:hypothetical protein